MFNFFKYFLFLLPTEPAHYLGLLGVRFIGLLHRFGLWPRKAWARHPHLKTQTPFGEVENPLGLAAGLDKNAEALLGWQALGFGFVEIGTVTPEPQPGNFHPRLFRYVRHRAIVNRMGFNNIGVRRVAQNIKSARARGLKIKLGGNISKNGATPIENAADDYRIAALMLSDCVDYLVINVSSPNTAGLRSLQSYQQLEKIIESVLTVFSDKPIFIKVAPDGFENYINDVTNIVRKF